MIHFVSEFGWPLFFVQDQEHAGLVLRPADSTRCFLGAHPDTQRGHEGSLPNGGPRSEAFSSLDDWWSKKGKANMTWTHWRRNWVPIYVPRKHVSFIEFPIFSIYRLLELLLLSLSLSFLESFLQKAPIRCRGCLRDCLTGGDEVLRSWDLIAGGATMRMFFKWSVQLTMPQIFRSSIYIIYCIMLYMILCGIQLVAWWIENMLKASCSLGCWNHQSGNQACNNVQYI